MPRETRGRLRPSSLAKIEKLVRRARTSMHCRSRNGNAWPQEASFGSGRRDRGSSHEASISPRNLAKAGPGNRPNPGKKGEGVSDEMAFFEWIARCKLVISFEGSLRVYLDVARFTKVSTATSRSSLPRCEPSLHQPSPRESVAKVMRKSSDRQKAPWITDALFPSREVRHEAISAAFDLNRLWRRPPERNRRKRQGRQRYGEWSFRHRRKCNVENHHPPKRFLRRETRESPA
jgi:hypothetical protein